MFHSKSTRAVAAALAVGAGLGLAAPAQADVTIGVLYGVTGPIANFIPALFEATSLAVDQINDQGGVLGQKLGTAVGDTQCAPQGAVDAAQKLVSVENVPIIVGALCSSATIAAANAVAIPNGVAMISPASTSPAISTLEDNDLVYRLVVSDAFQGKVLAKVVKQRGIKTVALTYVNNDYGVGLAGSFRDAFTKLGGIITADQVHEDKKASYRSELATLAGAKPDALVLISYAGGSGITMIRQSLENDFFDTFIGADGMRDALLIEQLGAENLKTTFGTVPSSPPDSSAGKKFKDAFVAKYKTTENKLFIEQTYDSVFVSALAIQMAGSTDRAAVAKAIRKVTNPPGVKIEPGEWAKALAAIKAGKDIDYEGVAGSETLDANGDVGGWFAVWQVEGETFKEVESIPPGSS